MAFDDLRRRARALMARAAAPRFLYSRRRLDHVFGEAARLRSGRLGEADFVAVLGDYFDDVGVALADEIALDELRAELERSGARKARIDRIAGDRPGLVGRVSTSGKLALLRRLDVFADVWALRRGQTVAPHAHHRVCAGLMVLEGRLAVRCYDRVAERDGAVELRPGARRELEPGDHTISSEHRDNVHWLGGLAPLTLAFRIEVRDVPGRVFAPRFDELDGVDRREIYVDPTGEPDVGVVAAPYVDRELAESIASGIVSEA